MIRILMAALTLFSITLVAQADPTTVSVNFNKIYVPEGFDSNDVVQLVGEGKFANSCYRPMDPTLVIDRDRKEIFVQPLAYKYLGMCLMYIVPYERSVDIGLLAAGTWTIYQGQDKSHGIMTTVSVRAATSESPDDYVYTPVNQVVFKQNGSSSTFSMTGEFANDCMTLDKILLSVQKNAVVLQPIAKVDTNKKCKNGKFPFSGQAVAQDMPGGRYLVHVRSMNGNSINSLISVDYVK